MRLRCYSAFMLLAGFPLAAANAQTAPVSPPTFYTTYRYTAYTVYDYTSPEAATKVSGVGGTLTLRPNGTYEKHLSIEAPSGPYYFNQEGTYATAGDSIRFVFVDKKGPDMQLGTFRLDSMSRHLTVTILGYPTGNKGVYELVADELSIPANGTKSSPHPRPGKKGRR